MGESGVWIPNGISREREWTRLEIRALFKFMQELEDTGPHLDGVNVEFKAPRVSIGGSAGLWDNTIWVNKWNPIVIVHEAAHFVAHRKYSDKGHGYWFKHVFQWLLKLTTGYIRSINRKQDSIVVMEEEFTIL